MHTDWQRRHFARVSRQMRAFALLLPVALIGITTVNIANGDAIAPWWFYILGVVGALLSWLIGKDLQHRAERN